MAYIEKKIINGRTYYYSTTTKRAGGKFKKTRKYLGITPPKTTGKKQPHTKKIKKKKSLITKTERKAISIIQKNYLKKHKISKKLITDEKQRIVSFIYNTNAIEGNTLTIEQTADILEGKIKFPKEMKRDVKEVKNMKKCVDFLFEYRGDIDEKMILRLHGIEQQEIMEDAGKYRKCDVKVGNYICPNHNKIKELMEEFVLWYEENKKIIHPFELAARAHLKFVKIHPFRDGNGRMARLLMNFILLRAGIPLLNIFNDKKTMYYLVLAKYDSDKKERSFVKYLSEVFVLQYKEYWK